MLDTFYHESRAKLERDHCHYTVVQYRQFVCALSRNPCNGNLSLLHLREAPI